MKNRDRDHLPFFGREVFMRRRAMRGEVTQKMIQRKILGVKSRGNIIGELESGRIRDPNPELLKKLSRVLKWDYDEMMSFLVREKYGAHLVPAREFHEGKTVSVSSSVVEGLRIRTVITRLPIRK